MQKKRAAPNALRTTVALVLISGSFVSANAVTASAQLGAIGSPPPITPPTFNSNSGGSLTLPPMREAPVSPVTPGTLPGTLEGSAADAIGINPVTGQPCSAGGASSSNGAPPGAPVLSSGMAAPPEESPVGGPPPSSVYAPRGAWNFGAC